jgi:hypothetical protein
VRVVLSDAAYRFVHVLRDEGFLDTSADGSSLSIAVKDPAAAAPHIVRTLVEAGAGVQTVTAEQPPLEQVYLRLLSDQVRLPSTPLRPGKPDTTKTAS